MAKIASLHNVFYVVSALGRTPACAPQSGTKAFSQLGSTGDVSQGD